jgi:hypothetical protein
MNLGGVDAALASFPGGDLEVRVAVPLFRIMMKGDPIKPCEHLSCDISRRWPSL